MMGDAKSQSVESSRVESSMALSALPCLALPMVEGLKTRRLEISGRIEIQLNSTTGGIREQKHLTGPGVPLCGMRQNVYPVVEGLGAGYGGTSPSVSALDCPVARRSTP